MRAPPPHTSGHIQLAPASPLVALASDARWERFARVWRQRGQRCAIDQDARHGSGTPDRSEEHTSELQSHSDLVCRLLLEKKKKQSPAVQASGERRAEAAPLRLRTLDRS